MGITVAPPSGWDATIYRRPPGPGEQTFPIVHAATVALPVQRGDYGAGLVERLGYSDVFVALLEFGPDAADTPLFAAVPEVPQLSPASYRPRQLQRTIAGQAGVQRFFTVAGRAFCLYSVIGSIANSVKASTQANQCITSLHISSSGI